MFVAPPSRATRGNAVRSWRCMGGSMGCMEDCCRISKLPSREPRRKQESNPKPQIPSKFQREQNEENPKGRGDVSPFGDSQFGFYLGFGTFRRRYRRGSRDGNRNQIPSPKSQVSSKESKTKKIPKAAA